MTFDISPELSPETKEIAAAFVDYVRDVGELDDLSATNSLAFANELDGMLNSLKAEGAIVYTAKHDRKFVGENWENKTPLTLTLGYLVMCRRPESLNIFTCRAKPSFSSGAHGRDMSVVKSHLLLDATQERAVGVV